MTGRKISDLPEAPYQKIALEAQERGISLTGGLVDRATDVMLIGVIDIIRELREKIEALEIGRNKDDSRRDE